MHEFLFVERGNLFTAASLLAAALLLGGSSGSYPFRTLALELFAIAALTFTLLRWEGPRLSWIALLSLGSLILLPVLQMVPLPPTVWMSLPGREVAAEVLSFAGSAGWRPLSIDAGATWKAALGLLVPIALFLATVQLRARERRHLVHIVVGSALVSASLGVLQLAFGGPYLFATEHQRFPIGLFANRNHQAALMYVALVLTMFLLFANWRRKGAGTVNAVYLGLILVFATTILATQSRMGLALLLLSLLLSAFAARPLATGWKFAGVSFIFTVVAVSFISNSDVARSSATRLLTTTTDGRYELWPEVQYSLSSYFPFGSGLGTFQSAYQATEQLVTLGGHYVNRAHNDYLEIVLETGIFGIVVLLIFLFSFALLVFRRLRRGEREDAFSLAAIIIILCLLLHSLVDYPVRTFALLASFAVFAAFLFPPREMIENRPRDGQESGLAN